MFILNFTFLCVLLAETRLVTQQDSFCRIIDELQLYWQKRNLWFLIFFSKAGPHLITKIKPHTLRESISGVMKFKNCVQLCGQNLSFHKWAWFCMHVWQSVTRVVVMYTRYTKGLRHIWRILLYSSCKHGWTPNPLPRWKELKFSVHLFILFLKIYLIYSCIWLHQLLVAACRIFSCSMQTLSCGM